jgi:hypothetical protein
MQRHKKPTPARLRATSSFIDALATTAHPKPPGLPEQYISSLQE